jgi:hypothetical protein
VPKSDSQVQRLLSTRVDVFTEYNQRAFEKEFERYFGVRDIVRIKESERTLYLMQRKPV